MTKVEKAILYVFLLITLSGALRKWVIDNSIINIILTTFPLLSVFLILYFLKNSLPKEKKLYSSKYGKFLVLFLFLLVPMAFNPLNHTFIHGIVGTLLHSGFWLLLFAYLSNRDIINFKKLIPYFIVISVLQVGVGIIQYNSPPDAYINQYAQSGVSNIYEEEFEEDIVYAATVSTATRASGTFSYIGGYASYMFFISYLFISYYNQSKKGYVLIGLFILSILGTLTTGSRSSLIIYIITIISFFYFHTKEKVFLIKMSLIMTLLAIVNIALGDITGLQNQLTNAIENITTRIIENQAEGNHRIAGPINSLLTPATEYAFLGTGLGTSYQGINSLLGSSKYSSKTPIEHEIGRTLLDGGYLLLLLKFALFFLLIRSLKGVKLFYLIVLPTMFLATLITTNPYTNFYLALGIMLLDYSFYKNEDHPLPLG